MSPRLPCARTRLVPAPATAATAQQHQQAGGAIQNTDGVPQAAHAPGVTAAVAASCMKQGSRPAEADSGPDGTNCRYTASDVTHR